MSLGALVREAREGRGWSQAQLGSLVGVTGATISRIESGERDPSWRLAHRIAVKLDIDLNSLKVVDLRSSEEGISSEEETATGAA